MRGWSSSKRRLCALNLQPRLGRVQPVSTLFSLPLSTAHPWMEDQLADLVTCSVVLGIAVVALAQISIYVDQLRASYQLHVPPQPPPVTVPVPVPVQRMPSMELPAPTLPAPDSHPTSVPVSIKQPFWMACLRCLPGPVHLLADDESTKVRPRRQSKHLQNISSPSTITADIQSMAELRPRPPPTKIDVLDSLHTPTCTVAFESRPDALAFHLLAFIAHDVEWQGSEDIHRCLVATSRVLATRRPFVTLYDFSQARLPPLFLGQRLLTLCVSWANENARTWDACNQGVAIVLSSPMLRSFLEGACRLVRPPQPIAVCSTRKEALQFLGSLTVTRSYVKEAY